MKCPHCGEEIQDGATKCRWCREFVDPADRPDRGGRPLARLECERLITMAVLLGVGVALIPIPGTTVALTGLELLLMGAMATVWGCPLTGSLVTTILTALAVRLGLTTALGALADLLTWVPVVGMVAKPAIAATTIKIVGGGLNDIYALFFGADHVAVRTAEEAKVQLEEASGRIKEYAAELKDGLAAAFRGDGAPLAATLNRIFGLDKKE